MNKDNAPTKLGHNKDSLPSKHKQLKDEKLAAALRANLRRRKIVSAALDESDNEGSVQ